MRLYESLGYLNNNNSNHHHISHANANDNNIDRDCNSNGNLSGNTVKTFTSNGNNQSNIDSVTVTSPKTATTNTYFEISDSLSSTSVNSSSSLVGCDVLNASENWQLETEFSKALSALNETFCFYGSQRKLKSREHLDIDDDNANGNGNGNDNVVVNSIETSSKDTVDLIDDSSSDIEAEINRLINRSNLCRQNFECESNKDIAPNTEEQLMDEEGKKSIFSILNTIVI